MLRIALQTLRSRPGSLAGAFLAILLSATLAYASGLLMSGALQDPGPGRLAAPDLVVRTDPTVRTGPDTSEEMVPAPPLDEGVIAQVDAVEGVARVTPDSAFPVGVRTEDGSALRTDGDRDVIGHSWSAAALTPYALGAGRAPKTDNEVVADDNAGASVGDRVTVAGHGGELLARVVGIARPEAGDGGRQAALFLTEPAAERLSGTGDAVTALGVDSAGASVADLRTRLQAELGPEQEVLAHSEAALGDAGDPREEDRADVVAIFGTMGGVAGAIALFVVSGTFSLALAQRRKEMAVLRALGATPRQVRRMVTGEALIVAVAGGALGVALGGSLAKLIVGSLEEHGAIAQGFELGPAAVPAACAVGLAVCVAQGAVIVAARRAGRTKPAEALREAQVEHGTPGKLQVLCGLVCLGGGAAMALVFDGTWARSFSILTGLLIAMGVCLLGRVLLGVPAATLALPLRRLGASGMLAGSNLAANRWRTAAMAAPVVLVTMMAGTQGIVAATDREYVQSEARERVVAEHVIVGADGAPIPSGTETAIAELDGVHSLAATTPLKAYGQGGALGEESPWSAVGLTATPDTLDLDVSAGSLSEVGGRRVAVSRVFAGSGNLQVGDATSLSLSDGGEADFEVAAIYRRAAGLGDVVLDPATARAHASAPGVSAIFVSGGAAAVEEFVAERSGLDLLGRETYLASIDAESEEDMWGIWMIIALATVFTALALVNTAAMSTTERRNEFAAIRLLGGSTGQTLRMVLLEMAPTVGAALLAGGVVVLAALVGVPEGLTGEPLVVPAGLLAGLVGGAIVLGLLASVVSAWVALRAAPTSAGRVRE